MQASIHARYVHMDNATVTVRQYADGSTALIAEDTDEDGYPNRETLSVNLSVYDLNPGEGHIYVPDYSEHDGLPVALEEAGLGSVVERITFGPFDTDAALFRIADALMEE